MSAEKSLDALRGEIDAIDNELHRLLIARSRLADSVARRKGDGGVYLRPGREAEVLRRLIANHEGPFPKSTLVRVWREIFSASVRQQGPFSIAVYSGEDDDGYTELARDQFGTFTPQTVHSSAQRVIDEVTGGRAAVGVLPMPRPLGEDKDPWWRYLVNESKDAPRIAVRLPFTGLGHGRGGSTEAIGICRIQQEQTSRDRSLFAIEVAEDTPVARINRAFEERGLPVSLISVWSDKRATMWLYLVEIDHFLAPDDERLTGLSTALGRAFRRLVPMGGYALPFAAADLADPSPAQNKGK